MLQELGDARKLVEALLELGLFKLRRDLLQHLAAMDVGLAPSQTCFFVDTTCVPRRIERNEDGWSLSHWVMEAKLFQHSVTVAHPESRCCSTSQV